MTYTLARLVFDSVVDSITIPNVEKNFQAFLDGVYQENSDFANQYAGVMSALNLGLSRLVDSHKIPFKVESVEPINNEFTFDKGRVINVFIYLKNGDYERFEFRTLGKNKYLLILENKTYSKVYVEYEVYFPVFTLEDCSEQVLNEDNELVNNDTNIDLNEYGLTSTHIAYLKEFIKGELLENYAPESATYHNNRAEQYFMNLPVVSTSFYQRKVKKRFDYGI